MVDETQSMAGKTVLVTGAPAGSARPPRWGSPRWAPGSPSPAGTSSASRQPRSTFAARPETRGGRVSCRHVITGRSAPPGRRGPRCVPAPGRPDQQRRRVLGNAPRHRRRAGAHLRGEPSRRIPPHRPAAGSTQGERPGPGGHRVVRRPVNGKDRLRRSPRRIAGTPGRRPTTSRSWPVSCSRTSWPADWKAPA